MYKMYQILPQQTNILYTSLMNLVSVLLLGQGLIFDNSCVSVDQHTLNVVYLCNMGTMVLSKTTPSKYLNL